MGICELMYMEDGSSSEEPPVISGGLQLYSSYGIV